MSVVLSSFSSSLPRDQAKFQFLNDEPCMIRHTFINLNLVELKYYPFIIVLNECTGSCYVLSPKYVF